MRVVSTYTLRPVPHDNQIFTLLGTLESWLQAPELFHLTPDEADTFVRAERLINNMEELYEGRPY